MMRRRSGFFLACALFFVLIGCSKQPTEQETEERAQEIFTALQTESIEQTYDTYGSKDWKEKTSLSTFTEKVFPQTDDAIEAFAVERVKETKDERMMVDGTVDYADVTKDVRMILTKQQMIDSLEFSNPVARLEFPDSIIEEDVTIGEETDFPLHGKVTLPKDVDENIPVVILVHGSGPADMDGTAYAYKPFRDIAWGLAERGVASIRYDKRTFVYGDESFSGGAEEMNVEEETIEDALQAVEQAVSDQRLADDHIYIIGQSLGGMLAPRIAVNDSRITGIISLAGSPRSLAEISLDQQQMLLDEQPIPSSMKEEQEKEIEELRDEVEEVLALSEEDVQSSLLGFPAYYLWEMEQYPVEEMIESLDIPMYILQGDEDFQVYKEKDFAQWKKLLADREEVTFSSYPQLNHFFIEHHEEAGNFQEAYEYPGIVSEEVIDDLATWIKEQ